MFDLLGELGRSPVDGLNPDGLARLVASVGQLVLGGIEGEGLHLLLIRSRLVSSVDIVV